MTTTTTSRCRFLTDRGSIVSRNHRRAVYSTRRRRGERRRRRATCSVRGEVQGRNKQWRWKIMNRIAYINTRRLLRHIVRFICMRQPRSRRAAGHTRDKRNAQTKHATRPRRVPRTRLTFCVPPSRAAHPIVIRYTPPFASHRLASHIPRSPECWLRFDAISRPERAVRRCHVDRWVNGWINERRA